MPSLYGTGTSYTITASNLIGLYQVSTSSAVITATTYSTNLVGLYGGYWSPNPITQFVNTIVAGPGISVNTSSGNVTVSNTGVLSLTAGTNTNVSSTTGNITVWTNPVAIGVTSLTAGTGISVSTSTGSVTVTNIGVTRLTAGTNTNISSTTGNITIWTNSFTGVTSLTAGTNTNVSSTTGNIIVWTNPITNGVSSLNAGAGISVSTSTGSVVVTNTGVLSLIAGTNTNISSTTGNITIWTNPITNGVSSLTAGTGISVSTSTGSVTVTNVGVTNLTGTSALGVSNSTGSITLTNLGVTSLTAGTNTNISASTGSITIWTSGGSGSSGVSSITASTGIGVSTSTGSVTITNLGVTSLTAGTGTNVSASTGSVTVWATPATPFDISTWTNQRLFTTSTVQFSGLSITTGTVVNYTVSAGGYPLDGNGQALLEYNAAQSPPLIVSNYSGSQRASVHVRSYGQNVPFGTTTTNAPAALYLESSLGSNTASTAVIAGSTIGQLMFSGYDGQGWVGTSGTGTTANVTPARIYVSSSEIWANNGTTTTNAGARITMDLQPQGAWLNSTSRQSWLNTSWTPGNTATNFAPSLNLDIGTTLQAAPTLTPSSGFGSFGVGFGATTLTYYNVRNYIYGVVSTDSAPDNTSLPNTNFINIVGNRQSGVSGRRQLLAANDSPGGITVYAQTVPNGTGQGLPVGALAWTMLEASTSTAVGTKFTVTTANTGTTSLTQRLSLDNLNNVYRSDNHIFQNTAGAVNRLSLNTTANSNTYNSDTHTFNNTAANSAVLTLVTGTNTYNNNTHNFNSSAGGGNLLVQFNTSTGVALKGYSETIFIAASTSSFAPNVSTATIWGMTLNSNITFNGFTNPQAGQSAVFFFVQDATGTRILSSTMKFAGGLKTLSTAGTSTDMISVLYAGAGLGYIATLVRGFV